MFVGNIILQLGLSLTKAQGSIVHVHVLSLITVRYTIQAALHPVLERERERELINIANLKYILKNGNHTYLSADQRSAHHAHVSPTDILRQLGM